MRKGAQYLATVSVGEGGGDITVSRKTVAEVLYWERGEIQKSVLKLARGGHSEGVPVYRNARPLRTVLKKSLAGSTENFGYKENRSGPLLPASGQRTYIQ